MTYGENQIDERSFGDGAELASKSDVQRVVSDLKNAVDFITTVVKYVDDERETKAVTVFNKDVEEAVGLLTTGFDNFPSDLAKAFLEGRARKHPEFKAAFDAKATNPAAWQAELTEATHDLAALAKRLPNGWGKGKTDPGNTGPTIAEKADMSPQQWKAYTDSLAG